MRRPKCTQCRSRKTQTGISIDPGGVFVPVACVTYIYCHKCGVTTITSIELQEE